jgi:hypothetical protein
MTQGNLQGTLVHPDFWPECNNCELLRSCQRARIELMEPRHPAFPHRWQWGNERVRFAEGVLVLDSWVGTSAIGEAHTGCSAYLVDPRFLLPLKPWHEQFLTLDRARREVVARLETPLAAEEEATLHTEWLQLCDHLQMLLLAHAPAPPLPENP